MTEAGAMRPAWSEPFMGEAIAGLARQTRLDRLDRDWAFGGATGRGVTVAIIDSGVEAEHPALAGWTQRTLPAMLAFSAPPDAVSDVWVGGRNVVANRVHAKQEDALREFNTVARRATDYR